ncbi:MAG TPA: hypothetical protein V6D19_07155 [Stenomitos sp.]
MDITIRLKSVEEEMPQADEDGYSSPCMVIVQGEIFDRAVCYDFNQQGWLWADFAVGNDPSEYELELGGENSPTHWAPWPSLPTKEMEQ